MIYFIDFDGTICAGGPPSPACIRTLKRLKECHHTIVIYSCRSNPNAVDDAVGATNEMKDYLNLYQVPYDRIEPNKPFFNFIIDDRALGAPLNKNGDIDWEAINKLLF